MKIGQLRMFAATQPIPKEYIQSLGETPLSEETMHDISNQRKEVAELYGAEFCRAYGWASSIINTKKKALEIWRKLRVLITCDPITKKLVHQFTLMLIAFLAKLT
jgi:hypothetical protein